MVAVVILLQVLVVIVTERAYPPSIKNTRGNFFGEKKSTMKFCGVYIF